MGFEILERRDMMAGDLIVNGSFEFDQVTAHSGKWELYDSVQGWTRDSGSKIELQRGILGGAAHGSQHVELDSNGPSSITQIVTTIPDQAYTLRFAFAGRPKTSTSENQLGVQIMNVDDVPSPTSFVIVASAGGSVANNTPKVRGGSGWQYFEAAFIATRSQTEIRFSDEGTNPNGLGTFLDNVSLKERTIEATQIHNLLVNGSFEEYGVSDHKGKWELYNKIVDENGVEVADANEIPGWNLDSGGNIELQRGILGGAAEGKQHLELDSHSSEGSSSISQAISTVAGEVYQLSFAFAGRPGTSLNDNILSVKLANVAAGNVETELNFTLIDGASGSPVADNKPVQSLQAEVAGIAILRRSLRRAALR